MSSVVVVAGTLLVSAAAKIDSMESQISYLQRSDWLPSYLVAPMAVGLPILEAGTALLIIVPITRRVGWTVALVLLSAFTLYLTGVVASGSTEACKCMGEIRLVENAIAHNRLSLLRNVFLMLIAYLGWLSTPHAAKQKRIGSPVAITSAGVTFKPPKRTAFTLAEVLVVVGVVGLLLAILLPTLASSRRAAQTIACAANLKEIGSLSAAWASSHKGFLPLDGEIRLAPDIDSLSHPQTVADPRVERYDYLPEEPGHLPPNNPSTFLAGLLRFSLQPDVPAVLETSGSDWLRDVRPRVSAAELLQCPSAPEPVLPEGHLRSGAPSAVQNEDGVFGGWGWWTTTSYSTNGGLLGFQHDPAHRHRAYRGQLSRVRSSATMVLAGDGCGDFMSWTPSAEQPSARVTLSDVIRRTNEITFWGQRKLDQLDPSRHGGRANLLFVDGHVAAIPVAADALGDVELLQE